MRYSFLTDLNRLVSFVATMHDAGVPRPNCGLVYEPNRRLSAAQAAEQRCFFCQGLSKKDIKHEVGFNRKYLSSSMLCSWVFEGRSWEDMCWHPRLPLLVKTALYR